MKKQREYSVCEKEILAAVGELEEKVTLRNIRLVQPECKRQVNLSRIQLRGISP